MDITKEELTQKIRTFNELMKDLSEDLDVIIMEHREKEFREELRAVLESLDKANETVRHDYNLFLTA